jgi:hypothetical protein
MMRRNRYQSQHRFLFLPFYRGPEILRFLVTAALRMPKLAVALLFLALIALASTLSYAGYLVVGVVAEHLGIGRVLAGLLLGGFFARIPWIRAGKLRTIGLLPKRARRPVMLALLAFCLLNFLYKGEVVPVLFTGFAGAFLLTYPRLRQMIVNRAISSFFKTSAGSHHPKSTDDMVIDVEFREKKD